jgi:predicted transcriptional regulator
MTPRRFTGFRIDEDQLAALEQAAQQEDRPVSYLIRKAIREWLERRESQKTERKRPVRRKRSSTS